MKVLSLVQSTERWKSASYRGCQHWYLERTYRQQSGFIPLQLCGHDYRVYTIELKKGQITQTDNQTVKAAVGGGTAAEDWTRGMQQYFLPQSWVTELWFVF